MAFVTGRHLKKYLFSEQVLRGIFTEGNKLRRTEVYKGFPENSHIADVDYKHYPNGELVIELYVECPDFPIVPVGEEAPVGDIFLKDIDAEGLDNDIAKKYAD